MKKQTLKRCLVLSIFVFFLVLIFDFQVMSETKIPKKTSPLTSKRTKDINYMKIILKNIEKLKGKSRRLAAQAESLVYIIDNLLKDCGAPNPEVDIPVIRTRLRELGFIYGDIGTHNKISYFADIEGLEPTSKIKLKPETRFPFSLLMSVSGGEVSFDKITWDRYIERSLGKMTGRRDSDSVFPGCTSFPFHDQLNLLTRISECKVLIEMAENIDKKGITLHKYHKRSVSQMRSIKTLIETSCSQGELKENRKRSLRGCANRIKSEIDKAYLIFDIYINYMGEWIKEYETCKKEMLIFRKK